MTDKPTWRWNISQGSWNERTGQMSLRINLEAELPSGGTDIAQLRRVLDRLVAVIQEEA